MKLLLCCAALAVIPFTGFAQPAATNVTAQAGDGSVTLHARVATPHGRTIRYEPQPHKNTIGYWTKAEDWVSWDFTLTKPGAFSVEMTQACGKGSGGSDYVLTVGGQTLKDTVPDTGAFTNFIQRTIGTVKLAAPGAYTLAVKPVRKPGLAVMDLRAVTLKPAP
jgi:hypothetical protein